MARLFSAQLMLISLALAMGANATRAQQVEIQINATVADPDADDATDDYVTWAPTFCRARLVGATADETVVLTNDSPGYYLYVSGNNLEEGVLEVGDRFRCQVDSETLEVVAASQFPEEIASQIADAWNASSVPEFERFNAVAQGDAILITAESPADSSDVTVSTVENDGTDSDGQWILKTTRGDLRFADHRDPWAANATATEESVSLDLTSDGAWHPFVIAGWFRRPSTNDGDAVIMAHEDTASGTVLGTKQLMVRVRKNANEMGTAERDRFLSAMRDFRNRPANGYLMFQELHRLSTQAGDEAHMQPSFYSWHRAYLLHVERELQLIDASVTLPYWNWDAASPNVFSQEFMGTAGTVSGNPAEADIAEPRFAIGHPFVGWDTDLPFGNGRLRRNLNDLSVEPAAEVFRPLDHPVDDDLLDYADYSQVDLDIETLDDIVSFSVGGEILSHNPGHNWPCAGGHLRFPMRSATDPLFYLLHSQVDRQWAYWQWKRDRFGVDVAGVLTFPSPAHYDNQGTFDALGNTPDEHTRQKGAYLEDGLWPWDGTSEGPPATPEERPPNQAPIHDEGLAQAGSNLDLDGDGVADVGTVQLRNAASSDDDFYNQNLIRIINGTGAGQSGVIFDYIGSDRLAGVVVLKNSAPDDLTWDTVPDSTSEYMILDSVNVPDSRPVVSRLAFPGSRIRHLWPGPNPIVPRNRHMIDYLGRFRPTDGLGFCYDDVPYETP